MSDAQSASALERLYEDTTVRDELVDDEARILLEWGKGQVQALAKKELDDGAFEEKYAKLTYLLGRINRFVGKRQDADDGKRAEMLDKLVAAASEAGLPIPAEKLAAFGKEHAALDNATALHTLTALFAHDSLVPTNEAVEPWRDTPSAPTLHNEDGTTAQSAQTMSEPLPNFAHEIEIVAQNPETSESVTPTPAPESKSFMDSIKQWLSSEGKE